MNTRTKTVLRRALSIMLAVAMCTTLMLGLYASAEDSSAPQSPATYDGHDLWLRYVPVSKSALLAEYNDIVKSIIVEEDLAVQCYRFADTPYYKAWQPNSNGIQYAANTTERVPESSLAAARSELKRGLDGLLDKTLPVTTTAASVTADGAVVVGTPKSSPIIASLDLDDELEDLYDVASVGDDGYIIRSVTINGFKATAIAANTELGALYGTFAFLRLIQTQKPINNLNIVEAPKFNHRRLNGWNTERLYAASAESSAAGTNGDTIGGGSSTGARNGESGDLFNWDLSPQTSGNTAHSTAAAVRLPIILDRYIIFARAAASIGINEININNVNTNQAFSTEYVIRQEAALCDALRPYGIKISVSVSYIMPTNAVCNQTGSNVNYPRDDTTSLGTASATTCNPYSANYQNWWLTKTIQFLKKIPDFAGYTIKANSEGSAGPQNYIKPVGSPSPTTKSYFNHGDGSFGLANLLQNITIPANPDTNLPARTGVTCYVFWRSFVYESSGNFDNDRLNRAYVDFAEDDALDMFLPNVFVQTKNGPLDFQPREMVSPMFGRIPNSNQTVEFQVTKEYLGQNKSFCYLGPMYEEFYKFDTYANGPGTLVGNTLDGSAGHGKGDTAAVGVHNLGNSLNFTGHHFDQSNFYVYGRFAWNWELTSEEVAEEWARMTWSNDDDVVDEIVDMMMGSREAIVSYQEPFGLMHQQYGTGNGHYPIMPWDFSSRDDYGPIYYNKASTIGLGWDRTEQGRLNDGLTFVKPLTPLVNQYFEPNTSMYSNIDECPEELIVAFHNVPWGRTMKSGNTFWEDLVYRYQMGVQYVTALKARWAALQPYIDARRFSEVAAKIARQEADAARFRDDSIRYFQTHSMLDIPTDNAQLSIKLVIGGRTYDGFNLSQTVGNTNSTIGLTGGNSPISAAYFNIDVCIPAGSSFTIDEVIPYSPTAKVTITQQASAYNGIAIVSVVDRCFFGEIRQDYRFIMVRDTTLKDIKIGDQSLRGFKSGTTAYSASVPSIPVISATPNDPTATVAVTPPTSLPGVATIRVTNSGATKDYTVRLGLAYDGNDEFNSTTIDPKWSWVRSNTAGAVTFNGSAVSMPLSYGNLHVASTTATGATNQNMLLEAAPGGDWMIETKIDFTSLLATANHEAGIVAYGDDRNYVAVAIRATSATVGTVIFNVKNNASTAATSYTYSTTSTLRDPVARLSRNVVWLRLYKKGNEYMGAFSSNGVLWKSVRFYSTAAVTPPARVTMSQVPTKVGMYTQTQAASGFNANRANFDYFRVTPMGGIYGFGAQKTANSVKTLFGAEEGLSGSFLVAVYKNGYLEEAANMPLGDYNGVAYTAEFPLDLAKYSGSEYTIKAFAWDEDGVPMAPAVTLQ